MARNEIVIKTALHEGIYKSDGGGETRIHYRWNIGPRNLMEAINTLPEHSESMERGYGNVGHQGSWIEVSGVHMHTDDLFDYDYDTDPMNFREHGHAISKTEWCRKYIASVLDGSLVREREETEYFFSECRSAHQAGFNAAINNIPRPKYDNGSIDYESEQGYFDGMYAIREENQRNSEERERETQEREQRDRGQEEYHQKRYRELAAREERNRRRIDIEVDRLRSIDLNQPITDEILKSVIRSIAVVSFKHTMPLGEWKRLLLAGRHNEIVRQYLDTEWLVSRVRNVVPQEHDEQ